MKWNDCNLIIFGLVMGAVLGAPVLEALALPNTLYLGSDGRLQWEILLTGVAALLAAGGTIFMLNRQIRQTGEIATDQRRRRARAARAILPLALSEVAEYATACINGLYALRTSFRQDGSLDQSHAIAPWTLPRLPENVLSSLKECIEFVDDTAAETMTNLIRHFQVQNSGIASTMARLRLNDGVHLVMWANIEKIVVDAAELHARASVLFPFARGDDHRILKISRSDIYTALFVAGCFNTLEEIAQLADEWQRVFSQDTVAA
jgi:hypothetical protein